MTTWRTGAGLNLITIILSLALLKPFLESWIISLSLPLSATVVQIALCVLALAWVTLRRGPGTIFNLNTLPLLVLLAYLGYSLTWSLDPVYGQFKWLGWINNALLPTLAIYALMTRGGQQIKWPWFIAFSAAAAASILLLGSGERNSLDALNVIWAGRIALTALAVSLFIRMSPLVRLPLIVLFAMTAFQAESRGPVVAFLVVMAGYLLYRAGAWLIRGGQATLTGVIAGMLLLVPMTVGAFALSDNIGVILDSRFATLGTDDDGNVGARTQLLGTAGQMFARSPAYGGGLGGFSDSIPGYYPHNAVAEFASEGGVVALALLSWLAIRAARAARFAPLLPGLLLLQAFGYALFSGSIAGNAEYFVLYAVLTASAVVAPIAAPRPVAAPALAHAGD